MAPLPRPRPAVSGFMPDTGGGGFLDGLWEKASGTFDRVIDLGLGALEFDLAQKAIQEQIASNDRYGERPDPVVVTAPQYSGMSLQDNLPMIAMLGGAALLLVLVLKK